MNVFTSPVQELAYFDDFIYCLKKADHPVMATGCTDQQKAHFVSGICGSQKYRLIITYNELRARELYEDYRSIDKNTVFYPAKDFIFYSADIHGNQITKERLNTLGHIIHDDHLTVITTIDGCSDKLLPLKVFEENTITLKTGDTVDLEKLTRNLVKIGYEKTAQTESEGQFSVRGGIIDIFPLTEETPVRIELWDDEIDSMRSFDVESQRSVENIFEFTIFPATEIILSRMDISEGLSRIETETKEYVKGLKKNKNLTEAARIGNAFEDLKEKLLVLEDNTGIESYINFFVKNAVSFLDYFPVDDTVFVVDEPNRIAEKGRTVEAEFRESMVHRLEKGYILPSQTEVIVPFAQVYAMLQKKRLLVLATLEAKVDIFEINDIYDINSKGISSYNNSFETLVSDLARWKKNGYRSVLVSSSKIRAERLAADLRENDVLAFYSDEEDKKLSPGEVMVVYGKLRKGYEYPDIKYVVIAENDIFGVAKKARRKKKNYEGKAIASFADLSIGDYVVHENHGLGIYRGIEKIEVDKVEKDYIKIEYAGSGNLYILATQLDLIQKYAGSDARKPKLNKLGSPEWNKTKTKVRSAVKEVAEELVKLYAIRQAKQGFSFSKDSLWQREFEELFPFEETADQLSAIEDTKKDMESHKIMDRLICGDVGYGKTEVAMRAAFKAIQDGKQVVYLVPTTILAQQHYNSFNQRMKNFGARVELLSRFRTAKQIKETLADLKKGLVDVIIGTHRVLSKDVVFKDLGLLIVDEEQRFGVTHKEKIKQLKQDVDVLTLTATPIPRTLHMSLVGIRDMSVLEEPPVDRLPIQTFVTEYDEEMVREAINRELARGGQVYYVFNRVNGIEEIALGIQKLVPDANVSFAHGQMSERELEKIMYDFINGEIDVLVSTTIIETGLDISNVNTIIIHDADRFGLSQLYQLRGRVGRSGRCAYAFLMYKRDRILKEVAEKRLNAIREFTELGSGFKIAMKDLEIRGAGNLLGQEQHGHMEAVGYDLYCKMLNEAVSSLKGEITYEDYETCVDLDIDAFIPASYIKSEAQKLDIYKRIAAIDTREELQDIIDELNDRFGDLPKSALNLINVAYIKSLAHKAYILEIKGDRKEIRIKLYPKARIEVDKFPDLINKYGRKLKFTNGEIPYFTYYPDKEELKNNESYLKLVSGLVEDIESIKITGEEVKNY